MWQLVCQIFLQKTKNILDPDFTDIRTPACAFSTLFVRHNIPYFLILILFFV